MLTIDSCVEQIEELVQDSNINGLLAFLGTAASVAADQRIALDLLIEHPEQHPAIVTQYREQFHIHPDLGIYHPSQYLLRILWDTVARVGPSAITFAALRERLHGHRESLEGLLRKDSTADVTRQAFNIRFGELCDLGLLFIDEADSIASEIIQARAVTKDIKERRRILESRRGLFLPVHGIPALKTVFAQLFPKEGSGYEDILTTYDAYLPLAEAIAADERRLLDHTFERHALIAKSLRALHEHFDDGRADFIARLRKFAKLFPERATTPQALVDKKTLLSLSTTFYYRFFPFFQNQRYPVPIVVMPGRTFSVETRSRIYQNAEGQIVARDKTDPLTIESRMLYQQGTIYLAADLELGLDPHTLFNPKGEHRHWPPVPGVARLFGYYVFDEIIKPREMTATRPRDRLLGLFDEQGRCGYSGGDRRDTYSQAVINYYDHLPVEIRQQRFRGDPRKYDGETWRELFSLHFAYWLVSKRLSDNPQLLVGGRHEFHGPTDGFHDKVYSWFDRTFLKKEFKPAEKLPEQRSSGTEETQ